MVERPAAREAFVRFSVGSGGGGVVPRSALGRFEEQLLKVR